MSAEVDKLYKETFGTDFSQLSPELMKLADDVVTGASSPSWVIKNGKPVYNPARIAFDEEIRKNGGMTAKLAQQIGVYASWRMGMMPETGPGKGKISELTHTLARRAGLPVDKIEKNVADRKALLENWAKTALNRFAHFVPAEDPNAKSGTAELKIEQPKPDAKPETLTNPLAIDKPAVQAAAAPAAPDPEGAPAAAPMPMAPPPVEVAQPVNAQPMPINAQPGDLPPMMPQNWQRQQLVNGQYVPME